LTETGGSFLTNLKSPPVVRKIIVGNVDINKIPLVFQGIWVIFQFFTAIPVSRINSGPTFIVDYVVEITDYILYNLMI